MFDNFNMKSKFLFVTAIIIAGLIVAQTIVYVKLDFIHESYDNNTKIQAKSDITSSLIANGLQCGQAIRNLYMASEDEQALKNLAKSIKELEKEFGKLKELDSEVHAALTPSFTAFLANNRSLLETISGGIPLQTNHINDNTTVWREFKNTLSKADKSFSVLKEKHSADFETAVKTAKVETFTINLLIIITVLASMILIIRSVTRSITLSVQTINEGAVQISGASDQVASSSTSLAQGASEQASSVEEISATLEQASAAVASNTESARQADMLAKAANQSAKDGMVKGDELVTSMKDVNDSASKIAGIVKAIDQIAFQVNLLALNAAVEAARAGDTV